MAVTSTLAPQAYTRDTLVKAIEWLSHQPVNVRERAKSADTIVSFFLQAQKRNGGADAPVSQEVFKADLKNLAQDLKMFEEPMTPAPHTANHGLSNHLSSPPHTNLLFNHPPPQAQPNPPSPAPSAPPRPSADTWAIDARSMAIAREVQQRLNLSHESEAIRFLITLGAERARSLFP